MLSTSSIFARGTRAIGLWFWVYFLTSFSYHAYYKPSLVLFILLQFCHVRSMAKTLTLPTRNDCWVNQVSKGEMKILPCSASTWMLSAIE